MIKNSWTPYLEEEFEQPYFKELSGFLSHAYQTKTIFPPKNEVFRAFEWCDLDEVKVVIIGQDPYHNFNQANGLCFSVRDGIRMPPSLQNIFLEIKNDLGKAMPKTGNLERWAKQGVLLLNNALTVEAHVAASHRGIGWEEFTRRMIGIVNAKRENVVYLLWGRDARAKKELIDTERNLVLEAAHPSPFSAHNGFFGCRHFSQANTYLLFCGQEEIDW
ncbi:uracil-DNA glycosylase [Microgenomates group bacterium]|nr:uracil-DNA glycosylase [Microgenomates group bacterium]